VKQISLITLTFIAAVFFAACGKATENKPAANTTSAANANAAATPVAAAPTKEALMVTETKAWEAWKAKDGKFFEEMLTDNTIGFSDKGRVDKAAIIKSIIDPTCDVKSFSVTEDQMTPLGTDVALITYKATQDGKCGSKALPGVVWAATVAVRSGDKWKYAYHNEIPVIDPKAARAKPASEKPADKKEAPKKDEARPAAPDAGTDAMLAVEKAVWEAWKAHDAKKIEALTAKDISFVNIFGTYFATKADAMKDWTGTKCEIKSVSVTDGAGTMLSPTVGILTFKGTADGTCYGQKVGVVWGTSVYVKDGENWKWAFGMNLAAS
jgi:Domain of unknown function (DUF4440)